MDQDGTKEAEKKDGAGQPSPRQTLSLLELSLKNIGPFDSANVRFLDDVDGDEVPVTIITGENGAGKSILIDAIRGMFGERFAELERPLWRPGTPFEVQLSVVRNGSRYNISSTTPGKGNSFNTVDSGSFVLPQGVKHAHDPSWIVDFWRSNLATDSYAIHALSPQNHKAFLARALQGQYQNANVTRLLCYFDYMRDSRKPREKRAGEILYETASRIVEMSLLDGKLLDVERSTFTPMVQQGAQVIPLANLSSGNAYLIQHMIGMLGKMHSANVLRDEDPERLCLTPGLLLLDEAENHLHPRWQKRFLRDVLSIFPNLQIIATTHSPFVVGSVPGAKVFVCQYDPEARRATVEDVTEDYANLPVEDILISPAFDGVEAFGIEITELLKQRRDAVEKGDQTARAAAEAKLYEKNPRYFSYLKLDERLQALKAG
ncbi:MAG: AAA family ATPase [Minicystis sp.]